MWLKLESLTNQMRKYSFRGCGNGVAMRHDAATIAHSRFGIDRGPTVPRSLYSNFYHLYNLISVSDSVPILP